MIISWILTCIIIIGMIYVCYINYKKCEGKVEKSLYILLCIILFLPILIYYLDRYNIPSKLNCNVNVNSQKWLDFFANYSSSVVSAIIGAYFLVMMTTWQINKNNEENSKRDKEERRLNFKPYFYVKNP